MVAVAFAVAGAAVGTPADAQESRESAVELALRQAAGMLSGIQVPAATAFQTGDRTIEAGTTVNGPVAVSGTLRIAGELQGDGFSYDGDIVVQAGARVTGSLVALGGTVRVDDAADVAGEIRSITGDLAGVATVAPATTTSQNVMLTLGWGGLVLLVGIGVLVFGGRTLDVVGAAVNEHFGRSFLVGIAGTLALAPVLALGILGLALTILGILLIPFAVVAYALAVTGLVTLGFLATAMVTGRALSRSGPQGSARGAALRSLVIGIALFVGLWLIAALTTSWPVASSAVRVIAFALTWATATVGLGATILTRGGTRGADGSLFPKDEATLVSGRTPAYRDRTPLPGTVSAAAAPSAPAPDAAPPPDWVTPTPVHGVVAARRPSQSVRSVK